MQAFLQAFFEDTRVQILLLLVVGRFAFGVLAALLDKSQAFRLAFVADILRVEILGKGVPFLVLYAGYKYAGNADIVIPGFDLEVLMNGAWGIITLSLGGAILNSLRELGLWQSAPDAIAGPDPTTPSPIPPS